MRGIPSLTGFFTLTVDSLVNHPQSEEQSTTPSIHDTTKRKLNRSLYNLDL